MKRGALKSIDEHPVTVLEKVRRVEVELGTADGKLTAIWILEVAAFVSDARARM